MRCKNNRKLGNFRVDKAIARGYGSLQGPLKKGVKVKVFRAQPFGTHIRKSYGQWL
jgi:hypothetical protein